MQGDRFGLVGRQRIAHAVPDVAPLAEFPRGQVDFLQLAIQRLQPRPVVPQYPVLLRQLAEERQRLPVLLLVRPVQADDDLGQVGHLLQLGENMRQRLSLQLRVEGGQDEPQGTLAGKFQQLPLQFLHRSSRQVVQGGDDAVLVEIAHASLRVIY